MNTKDNETPKPEMSFFDAATSRRSVRVFDGEPIPPEVIQRCLDMALLAPNSSNLQPWEFHWVKDPTKKKALVAACMGQPAAATASEIIVCVGRTRTWMQARKQMLDLLLANPSSPQSAKTYYKTLVPLVYTQGPYSVFGLIKKLAFSVIGIWKAVPREPMSQAQMRTWAVKSTALAAQNFMLAARAQGYDTCPMEGLDSYRVKRLLKLPCDAQVVMAIGVGRRTEKGIYGAQIRFERENYVKIH